MIRQSVEQSKRSEWLVADKTDTHKVRSDQTKCKAVKKLVADKTEHTEEGVIRQSAEQSKCSEWLVADKTETHSEFKLVIQEMISDMFSQNWFKK